MEQLLSLLKMNARMSLEDLALATNQSVEGVASQIEHLEKKQVIAGYTTVLDTTKLEPRPVTAWIEVKMNPKKDFGFDYLVDTLLTFEEVVSVYLMAGDYDLAVVVSGTDLMEVSMFVSRKLATLDSVVSTATHFVLQKYKDSGFNLKKDQDLRENMI